MKRKKRKKISIADVHEVLSTSPPIFIVKSPALLKSMLASDYIDAVEEKTEGRELPPTPFREDTEE